ncbi:MAG: helix-hairpin-helix domain-containing protein [Chloroherpetonaceae bacterium]|nr:helix-hairpin-helix domain-containing protein [Chloroherpetonaceae bacterium]
MKWLNQFATKLGILRAEIIIIVGLISLFLIGILAQIWQGSVSRDRLLREIRAEIFYETEADSLMESDSLLLELSNPYPTLVDSQGTVRGMTSNEKQEEKSESRKSGNLDITGQGTKLNINTATEEDLLKTLPYIEPALANRIIRFRKSQGGKLYSLDELLMVRGIGEKTLNNYKRYLTLDTTQTR